MKPGDGRSGPGQHWWHGPFRRFGGTRPGAWIGAHLLHHLDRLAFRFGSGEHSAAEFLGGIPVITLTTTGARSGRPRTVPLNEIRDGDNFILIASNWGQAAYPAWYYNLRTNPAVTVSATGQSGRYLAHETQGEEYDRCREIAVSVYPSYSAYEKRLERPVPVILLQPV